MNGRSCWLLVKLGVRNDSFYWARSILHQFPLECSRLVLHDSVDYDAIDDDGDDGDDDKEENDGDGDDSIHPKALFPAPHAAGRYHHLSDFCQNIFNIIIIGVSSSSSSIR